MASQIVPQPNTEKKLVRSYARANRKLAESFDRYQIARGQSANTLRSYHESVAEFLTSLGAESVIEADRTAIRIYQSALLERGLSEHTIRLRTVALRAFFKFLSVAGLTRGHNPTLLLSYRKLPGRVPRVLTISEVEKLIAAAKSPVETAIVETLYATGVRVSELCALRFEDVDFAGRVIRVKNGKGGKDRIVLFGSNAADALRRYLDGRKPEFLFEVQARTGVFFRRGHVWFGCFCDNRKQRTVRLGKIQDSHSPDIENVKALRASGIPWRKIAQRTGLSKQKAWRICHNPDLYRCLSEREAVEKFERLKAGAQGFQPGPARPYSPRGIRWLISRLAARAGIGDVYPHSLRRAFATHMLEGGADLRVIQELMGHVNLSTTMIYTSLSAAKLKEVHDRCHPHAKEKQNVEEK
jgi:integrase/recombinase XerD